MTWPICRIRCLVLLCQVEVEDQVRSSYHQELRTIQCPVPSLGPFPDSVRLFSFQIRSFSSGSTISTLDAVVFVFLSAPRLGFSQRSRLTCVDHHHSLPSHTIPAIFVYDTLALLAPSQNIYTQSGLPWHFNHPDII